MNLNGNRGRTQRGGGFHCEAFSKAMTQQNQGVEVKTHQQFVEKAAATIEMEALCASS